jgi:hypothetical protein
LRDEKDKVRGGGKRREVGEVGIGRGGEGGRGRGGEK